LIIVSLLVSLAAVGPAFVRTENVTKASRELLGDLQRIRQDAMTRRSAANGLGFGIRLIDSKSYTIFEFNDADGDFKYDGAGEEAIPTSRALNSSVVINIDGVAPDNKVLIYDKLGIPRSTDWALENLTLVVKHESAADVQQKCVVVSTNRVREGLWDGSSCDEQ